MGRKRRRRNWSDEEKRMICAQTKLPGVSVSQVARRYDVNTNLVFIWLRDERYNVEPEEVDVARFLPVEVIEPMATPAPRARVPRPNGHCTAPQFLTQKLRQERRNVRIRR